MQIRERLRRSLEVAPTTGQKATRAAKLVLRELRVPTGRFRTLPDFLIIGAQKAGTSSLYRYLCRHPDVARAFFKEVHYFDRHRDRGVRWYRSHFPLRARRRLHRRLRGRPLLTGEATPDYLFDPRVPGRIRDVLPDARLVVLLRDPVRRALSHFHHERRRGRETLTFEEAVRQEEARVGPEEARMLEDDGYYSYTWDHFSYVRRGLYARHLGAWLNVFPREQILVLEAESFFGRTAEHYRRVLDFLDLPHLGPTRFPAYNTGSYRPPGTGVERELREYYRRPNQELAELLGISFSWG